MTDVARTNAEETGDSQKVACPMCAGTKKHPFYGTQCPTCVGTGWLYQQRFDANGRAIRVNVVG